MPGDHKRQEPAPQNRLSAMSQEACENHLDSRQPTTILMGVDECETCAYAEDHGWWGPDHRGTHCQDCHRSWTGMRESHCVECHLHFSTDSIGDKHRDRGQCLPISAMTSMRRRTGEPIFDLQSRASGLVVVWWRSPETRQWDG